MSNELFDVNPHESFGPTMPKDWKGPLKIMDVKTLPNQAGGSRKNVEFVVANGDFEGKKMFKTFFTNSVPSADKIAAFMADNPDATQAEAEEALTEEYKTRNNKELLAYSKLVNAAGYINEKYATDEDKQRIAEERAWPLTGDWTDDMLQGKLVLASTKPNKKGYQEPTWFEDADGIGDVGGSAPI